MKIHCDSDALGRKPYLKINKLKKKDLSLATNKQQKIDTMRGSELRLLENCYSV